MKKYLWNFLISIDQLGNTIIGGDPDETISSRIGKAARAGKRFAIWAAAVLHIIDKDHAEKSIDETEGKDEVWQWVAFPTETLNPDGSIMIEWQLVPDSHIG